jgi:isoleucyl-tRNA synthetase
MSKRLKNYPDPDLMIQQFGADAIRLYFLNSPAVIADDLRFSEKGVELVMRQVLIPFWNSYVFLSTYARIYDWVPKQEVFNESKNDIDRFILSLLHRLIDEVTQAMDRYELARAVEPFVSFIDQLTNWYIRRSRARFWSEEATEDRNAAFETLYTVLLTLSKIAAPFIPFMSDAIYLKLRRSSDPVSVHLCEYPTYLSSKRDLKLEKEMVCVQAIVSAGHALRKEHRLKVRQPLRTAHISAGEASALSALKEQKQLILDELNVKEIIFHADESSFVALSAKPNFRILGKKVGKLLNAVQKKIQDFNQTELTLLMQGSSIEMIVEGEKITLTPEDVAVERKVLPGIIAETVQGMTVALDTTLDEELLLEGLARELVNKINTMRRDEGYEVVDRIKVRLQTTEKVKICYQIHRDYICHEVLATEIRFEAVEDGTAWDLNGESTTIALSKS